MKYNRFATTDTSPGTLRSADGSEWMPRRMLTLEDEVGSIRPGYVKPAYVKPPVKFEHTETPDERAERLAVEFEKERDGDPYPLWIHALAWLVLIGFSLGCVAAVVNLIK